MTKLQTPITIKCPECGAVFKTKNDKVHCLNCSNMHIDTEENEVLTGMEDQLTT